MNQKIAVKMTARFPNWKQCRHFLYLSMPV